MAILNPSFNWMKDLLSYQFITYQRLLETCRFCVTAARSVTCCFQTHSELTEPLCSSQVERSPTLPKMGGLEECMYSTMFLFILQELFSPGINTQIFPSRWIRIFIILQNLSKIGTRYWMENIQILAWIWSVWIKKERYFEMSPSLIHEKRKSQFTGFTERLLIWQCVQNYQYLSNPLFGSSSAPIHRHDGRAEHHHKQPLWRRAWTHHGQAGRDLLLVRNDDVDDARAAASAAAPRRPVASVAQARRALVVRVEVVRVALDGGQLVHAVTEYAGHFLVW